MTGLHRRSADLTAPPGLVTRTLTDAAGHELSLRAAAADDGPGTFEGYACLWDVRDAYGTSFARGSFGAGGLDTREGRAGLYALLHMHAQYDPPIGTFAAREDDTGLWIAGEWDPTPEGTAARARAKSGSASELSVGFVPLMVDPDDESIFTQVRLVEVSQITARMAAVPGAGFAGVRGLPAGRPGDTDAGEQLDASTIATLRLQLAHRVTGASQR